MRDPVARFWAVEHVTMMILAVALGHVGRVLARKARQTAASAHGFAPAICFGLATIADDCRHAVARAPRRPAAVPRIIAALRLFTTETPALAWLALAIVAAIVEVSIPHFGVDLRQRRRGRRGGCRVPSASASRCRSSSFVVVLDRVARRCCGPRLVSAAGRARRAVAHRAR